MDYITIDEECGVSDKSQLIDFRDGHAYFINVKVSFMKNTSYGYVYKHKVLTSAFWFEPKFDQLCILLYTFKCSYPVLHIVHFQTFNIDRCLYLD